MELGEKAYKRCTHIMVVNAFPSNVNDMAVLILLHQERMLFLKSPTVLRVLVFRVLLSSGS